MAVERTIQQQKAILRDKIVKHNDGYEPAAKLLDKEQPYFYDKNEHWWYWNKTSSTWNITTEIGLLVEFDKYYRLENSMSIKRKFYILDALRRIGHENTPKEPPKEWIQFKNTVYDIITGEERIATREYFFTNVIPHDLGTNTDTPTIDRLFQDWVGDKKSLLYEIIAYCLYPDYPIHAIFGLIGTGRNGKSTYLRIISKFLGNNNICSTELTTLLDNRFATYSLYKKMAVLMGETNFNRINNTMLLKNLSGNDPIQFEQKYHGGFTSFNYAKIIISTNSMPPSSDASDGWFRRWRIIEFKNNYAEGTAVEETIPIIEYNNLCRKATLLLPALLAKNKFSHDMTIEERKLAYLDASNPLTIFITNHCVKRDYDNDYYVKHTVLYAQYARYLKKINRRVISRKEFSRLLDAEGYDIFETTRDSEHGTYVFGLRIKTLVTDYDERPKRQEDLVVLDDSFISKQEVVRALTTSTEMSITDLQHMFPCEELMVWLSELRRDGVVVEPRQGIFRLSNI